VSFPLGRGRLPPIIDAAHILFRAGLCNGQASVRPSVRPSVPSIDRSNGASGFAAERHADRRCRSIAAGAVLQAPCCRRQRSAANAASVSPKADEVDSTLTCF